jgi:UrcA family protein
MNPTIFRTLACAGTLLLAEQLHSTRASAEPPMISRSVKVEVSDLDLSQPQGQRILRHRIAHAAREVCGPETSLNLTVAPEFADFHTCYRRAMQGALAQVRMPAPAHDAQHSTASNRR